MSAAAQATAPTPAPEAPRDTTLLDLIQVIGETTDDEREVVAIVLTLLRSGQIRLCGNFRGATFEDFLS